jgi:hypothetical protein
MRIVWLTVVAAAGATTVLLVLGLVRWSDERRGRTLSALVTVGAGPLGIATLMAIFTAAVGAAAERIGKDLVWRGARPLCLSEADAWRLEACVDDRSAWDFAATLLTRSIYPLAWAVAVAAAAGAVLAAALLAQGVLRRRDARVQAARLTRRLAIVDSAPTLLLVAAATLAAAYVAAAAWLPFLPLPFGARIKEIWGPPIAAVLGGAVTTLLVAARAIGLRPRTLAADGRAPGVLRALLDKPYDIATFLREPLGYSGMGTKGREVPRKKMLRRYRRLMEHLAADSYDRVVFVAHSQGTVLTTALLADRRPEQPALPASVSLMTFGCPLRQLYLKRFPSQYAWVARLAAPAARRDFVHRVNGEWVNVATADDPIGRTVFVPPPDPWVEGTTVELPEGTPRVSELLLGTGGHAAYWSAEPLYRRLAALVDA